MVWMRLKKSLNFGLKTKTREPPPPPEKLDPARAKKFSAKCLLLLRKLTNVFWENSGWKMIHLLLGWSCFRGHLSFSVVTLALEFLPAVVLGISWPNGVVSFFHGNSPPKMPWKPCRCSGWDTGWRGLEDLKVIPKRSTWGTEQWKEEHDCLGRA